MTCACYGAPADGSPRLYPEVSCAPDLLLRAAAAVLALGVAGCGAASSPSAPAASGGAGQTKTVNPNGPEVNPAGDIPDNQAYVAYAPPGAGYSVKVPEGWARTTAGRCDVVHRQAQPRADADACRHRSR